MWSFEGSNEDKLWVQIGHKNQQLELQLSLLNQRDEQLKHKDALLQETRVELTSALKENALLREQRAHSQNELKKANH
jgi:hypothetical protein